jgi:hypothetical protein
MKALGGGEVKWTGHRLVDYLDAVHVIATVSSSEPVAWARPAKPGRNSMSRARANF